MIRLQGLIAGLWGAPSWSNPWFWFPPAAAEWDVGHSDTRVMCGRRLPSYLRVVK